MTINSVDKAITVLNCFSMEEPVLGVGAISRMTGLTLSTVSRLLSTMESRGVVQKGSGRGRYRLGYRIYVWGLLSQGHDHLAKAARPAMEALRDRCAEEVSLHIVTGDCRTCIQRVPSRHAIAMTGRIGGRLPLHAGASGRVLLAHMDARQRKWICRGGVLERYTDHTLTDPHRLEAELDAIRRRGYAFSREEREPGAYSVVAPVKAVGGRVVASLTIAGPLYRLEDSRLTDHIADVQAAAAAIGQKLSAGETARPGEEEGQGIVRRKSKGQ